MTPAEVGRYWDDNADVWTTLARQGWDVYRDVLNTPAFLAMLPDVQGLHGLDLGCGEGHNTRLLARAGAHMTGLDMSAHFIGHACQAERHEPLGIRYLVASAQEMPWPAATFDFVTAFMSLTDMPGPELALTDACRVLKPGGFLQFSITHPCFFPPHRRLLRDAAGTPYAIEAGRYFETGAAAIEEWLFSAAPADVREGLRPFRIPRFHHTLSWWLNAVVDAGLAVERVEEPTVDAETATRTPHVADTRVVGYFLHVRCRRLAGPAS